MQRSWMVIAGVVVLALVLVGGGYWWLHHSSKKTTAASQRPHLIGMLGDNATELDNAAPDQDKICEASLARGLSFGALPPGASLASSEAKAGQPEGHYTCDAQGADGKYTLNIDLTCPSSDAKTCFTLDSVRREDGTYTYQIEHL
ncbi:MAG TPA: hypothetical protein VFV07_06315 [Rhizomicrobium sp.]|nr:hypothetical protein [Rhizomicrobium sp.]